MISFEDMASSCVSTNVSTQYHSLRQNRYLAIRRGEKGHQLYSFEHHSEGMVEVGFNLGGMITCSLNGVSSRNTGLEIPYEQVHMKNSNEAVFSSDQPLCWVGLLLPVSTVGELFGESLPGVELLDVKNGKRVSVCKNIGSVTTEMKVSLHQIMQCPFLGKTKCLFLESKVLELLSHVRFRLELGPEKTLSGVSIHLNTEDKEKMWRAKAFLDENLEVPPSIMQLAQYVGVNEYKLKNGFRQVHGITPYKYIVEQRLEWARRLLWNRDMNVTEAAFAVGYSSLSHFAKIFRDKFGVSPHEYLA